VTAGPDEFALINRLASLLDPPTHGIGIGDDAATWSPTPGTMTVATADMLVEGIHFRLDWTTPEDLGWKAMAVNLSDIAAMGARPRHALVSIALKPDQAGIVIEIYKGIAAHARASARSSWAGTPCERMDRSRSMSPSLERRTRH
jgi:thiamine-monophosphate kinase